MIRYVLTVLLTVAILGLAMPAVEDTAGKRSDQQMANQVAEIERAAVSLVENEELPPEGEPGARRSITLRFPDDGLLSQAVTDVEIERVRTNMSVVHYRVEGRPGEQVVVDAPVVNAAGNDVRLGGTGEKEFVLTYERNETGAPTVFLKRR
ncbi:hypothetical protein BV210_05305 [Halorientalis sp. IM1011]|uniref:DUF7311 family protein n=1 Tax=Halorientalis sp. IM1011 TaxID=1932360 RepID=UPI00097CCC8D|nr:hypothetical protein [Halorientalis sp. IM1011]AQL42163.1 hypothetical protein BV210_05305 [Halorientalis sp. IM1011]